MRQPPKKLDEEQLTDWALKTLGGRAHSMGELRQKLLKRAADPADVEPVIGKMREYGYLNDRRFAELFAQTRQQGRGLGQIRVLRDLRERRVAPKLAEQVVQQTFAGQDETQLIEDYLARKYRGKDLGAEFAEDKKVASAYRRLRTAGYSHGAITKVLLRYANQGAAEALDTMDEPDDPNEPLNKSAD